MIANFAVELGPAHSQQQNNACHSILHLCACFMEGQMRCHLLWWSFYGTALIPACSVRSHCSTQGFGDVAHFSFLSRFFRHQIGVCLSLQRDPIADLFLFSLSESRLIMLRFPPTCFGFGGITSQTNRTSLLDGKCRMLFRRIDTSLQSLQLCSTSQQTATLQC